MPADISALLDRPLFLGLLIVLSVIGLAGDENPLVRWVFRGTWTLIKKGHAWICQPPHKHKEVESPHVQTCPSFGGHCHARHRH